MDLVGAVDHMDGVQTLLPQLAAFQDASTPELLEKFLRRLGAFPRFMEDHLARVNEAMARGIPRERWVFPLASTESNHQVPVSARAELTRCPGARLAGEAALDAAGLSVGEIDLLDLWWLLALCVRRLLD